MIDGWGNMPYLPEQIANRCFMSAISGKSSSHNTSFSGRLAGLLGRPASENLEADLAKTVPLCLELKVLDALKQEGLTQDELLLVINKRTLTHRRLKGESLKPDESDRALRLARLIVLAESIFGNHEKALAWLRKPQRRFSSHSPMDLMKSEMGGRLVEESLIQLDEGYFS